MLGVFLGTAVLWASVTLYGLLAAWAPWPVEWWRHHPQAVFLGSKVIALTPGVFILGFLLDKLFKVRPVLNAVVSMALTLLVACADTFRTPELIGPMIRLTWPLDVTFLVGPPFVVYLLNEMRSNKRLERP